MDDNIEGDVPGLTLMLLNDDEEGIPSAAEAADEVRFFRRCACCTEAGTENRCSSSAIDKGARSKMTTSIGRSGWLNAAERKDRERGRFPSSNADDDATAGEGAALTAVEDAKAEPLEDAGICTLISSTCKD